SAVLTCSGPFSVTFTKVASGSFSPVWIVMVGILSLEGVLVAPTSGAPVAKSRMARVGWSFGAKACVRIAAGSGHCLPSRLRGGRGVGSDVAIAHPAATSEQVRKFRCPSRLREGKPAQLLNVVN